jgi:UDP-N-acetyl-D-galactosamine dehydrogenase
MKNIIAIIGLGYVGLPLALAFSKKFKVIGYDKNIERIKELKKGIDKNKENKINLRSLKKITFSYNANDISTANIFIITVPTPVFKNKKPDLRPLFLASKIVGKKLKKDDLVIYESTVYPGCTEDYCVPILQKYSKLEFNKDFYCGYSPERINPGDKIHRLENIIKVTSGSNKKVASVVSQLYKNIIKAGVFNAKDIKTAEAAKIIENTQRDLNIAYMNELSMIFKKLDIETNEVLKASYTKWNFLKFRPGLVGGHCINVDPYYLTHKAQLSGYKPKVILAGRKLNDSMPKFIIENIFKKMKLQKIKISKSKILVLGVTFKENCSDTRNSQIAHLHNKLLKNGCIISLYDPHIPKDQLFDKKYKMMKKLKKDDYDSIVIAVGHKLFKNMGIKKIRSLSTKNNPIIFDIKGLFKKSEVDFQL